MSDTPGLVELARLPEHARADLLSGASDLDDPLRAVSALRRDRPDLSPDLASAVITQRGFRAKGLASGALPGDGPWLTTEVGLEQATRPEVAEHRARTLAAAGVRSVVDASAGIGMDARAFLAAGLDVVAFERDAVTFEVCKANLEHAQAMYAGHASVEFEDSTREGVVAAAVETLPAPVAVFVDPGRRSSSRPVDGTRSRSERDRQLWSPPWSFVEELRAKFDYMAAKTPPGFSPDEWWKAEWVAVGSSVVECALYSPAASRATGRCVTILTEDDQWSLDFDADARPPAPTGLRDFLAEVHPVARRAGAIARICADAQSLAPVTESSMWLTSDAPATRTPAMRWFAVLGYGSAQELASLCRDRGIERVALKTAESRRPQSEIRSRVGLPDGDEYAIVVVAGLRDYVLVRRTR